MPELRAACAEKNIVIPPKSKKHDIVALLDNRVASLWAGKSGKQLKEACVSRGLRTERACGVNTTLVCICTLVFDYVCANGLRLFNKLHAASGMCRQGPSSLCMSIQPVIVATRIRLLQRSRPIALERAGLDSKFLHRLGLCEGGVLDLSQYRCFIRQTECMNFPFGRWLVFRRRAEHGIECSFHLKTLMQIKDEFQ